jgi:DNA-binding CsgD family transcriptional regulator
MAPGGQVTHQREHTVISHRKNMMAKTNSANIAELISWAIRNEII